MYLVGASLKELEAISQELGYEPYRGRQIAKWIYKKLTSSFEDMTDIPKDLRKKLKTNFSLSPLKIKDIASSRDGSKKFLFELPDGSRIESVHIPDGNRRTLCISTQVGCPLSCKFCLTGRIGFIRNLTVSEIVSQLWEVRKRFPVTNVVFMGMGEPLLNWDNVKKAIDIIVGRDGFDLSWRRVTVSTAGIVPVIKELCNTPSKLAVSINSTFDEVRSYLMPINRKYPLESLITSLEAYHRETRKMITLEYVLIKGVNCNKDEAERLASIAKRVRGKVNLIPFNETPYIEFKSPEPDEVLSFQKILFQKHVTALIRDSRGGDILAACGQLAGGYDINVLREGA